MRFTETLLYGKYDVHGILIAKIDIDGMLSHPSTMRISEYNKRHICECHKDGAGNKTTIN